MPGIQNLLFKIYWVLRIKLTACKLYKIMGWREKCDILYICLHFLVLDKRMMSKITDRQEWKSSEYLQRGNCIIKVRAGNPITQLRQLLNAS